jgi:hypothetical protein
LLQQDAKRNDIVAEFTLVHDRKQHVVFVEESYGTTGVMRINRENGDIESLDDDMEWRWHENVYDKAPVKVVKAWAAKHPTNPDHAFYRVWNDYDDARKATELELFEGFSTDHHVPDVGDFYLKKSDLLEDLKCSFAGSVEDTTEVKTDAR